MSSISTDQVEHIAKLARIELTEKEKGKFSKELSSILDYIDKLNKVDTENIRAIQQITGLETVMREDEVSYKLQVTSYKLIVKFIPIITFVMIDKNFTDSKI